MHCNTVPEEELVEEELQVICRAKAICEYVPDDLSQEGDITFLSFVANEVCFLFFFFVLFFFGFLIVSKIVVVVLFFFFFVFLFLFVFVILLFFFFFDIYLLLTDYRCLGTR